VAGANTLGRLHSVLTVTLALVCCSCETRPLQGALVPTAESASGASRVPILIATTRQRSSNDVGEMFSSERADATSYAKIVVSIPPQPEDR
jgi:esterase/lipase superfamily enzyme